MAKQKKEKKTKPRYPRKITVRFYNKKEETSAEKLMLRTEKNTMSKAFLAAPDMLEQQSITIGKLNKIIQDQNIKIEKLSGIVASWAEFYNKLDDFCKKR